MTSGVFRISRRVFLRFGVGAVTTFGGVGLLSACAPASSAPPPPTQPAPPQATTAAAASTAPAVSAAQPTAPPAPTVAPAAAAPPTPTAAARAAVKLPTYVPLAGIRPDLPPSADGLVDAGFVNYPANPIKTVQDTPGRGGESGRAAPARP